MNYNTPLFLLLIFIFHGIQTPLLSQLEDAKPKSDFSTSPKVKLKPGNQSVKAKLLDLDLERGMATNILEEKYNLSRQGDEYFIPALVKVADDFDHNLFKIFQVQVNTAVSDIYSIQIPVDHYQAFIASKGIAYLEMATKIYPKLDSALAAARVDLVHLGVNLSQPYSGKEVVIGIIDFGFDYTHPTFYNPETGEYRIKRVWEQNTLNSTPPSGFSYGEEVSDEEMLILYKTDISSSGHGTHVASVAAGSGGELSRNYRGVAYESEIVLVSLNVREGTSGLNTGVIDGINYIFQYAESVGKPAVINISQGHHTGPHDGTSLADQAIDAMSGPGRIIVGAVGNEGDPTGFYLHFDHTFDNENEILGYLVWPDEISAGTTLVDLWGEVGSGFQVGLEIFNPKTKQQEAVGEILQSGNPVSFIDGIMVDEEGDTLYYEGGIEINPLNNRPHAQFYVDNTAQLTANDVNFSDLLDNDFVQFRFQGSQGTVHAYAANNSGEAFFTDLSGIGADEFIGGVRVIGGNPQSTMGELGVKAYSVISVGGYYVKNSFINTFGQVISTADIIGEQYVRSSRGPTLDGRIKPEICAPTSLIAAAENSFNQDFDQSLEVDQIEKEEGSHWSFGIRRGTSIAAPIVAGVVALMLEVNPDLSPGEAREILTGHAWQDNFTGAVPNNSWGYGKINTWDAISSLDQLTGTNFTDQEEHFHIFPNPNRGAFNLESDTKGPVRINILDTGGSLIFEKKVKWSSDMISLNIPFTSNGIYYLQLVQKDITFQKKMIILD